MNNLNSILIEGKLVDNPRENNGLVTMTLRSIRYYKSDDGFKKEYTDIEIETTGKLGESCLKKGKKGRGLRVVGRIAQRWYDDEGKPCTKITIVAEHVEFRPDFKEESDD